MRKLYSINQPFFLVNFSKKNTTKMLFFACKFYQKALYYFLVNIFYTAKHMWLFRTNLYYFFTQNGFTFTDRLLLASLVFIAIFALLALCRTLAEFIINQLENRFRNNHFKIWLNITNNLSYPFIIFTSLFAASFGFYVSPTISNNFDNLYIFILILVVINFVREVITNSIRLFLMNKEDISKEAINTATNFVNVTSLIVLWILAILLFLQFSQFDTQALLGGLGIASIIIAFAFQSFLKDIFAFFSIYIDRSFAVGDYIVFGKVEGTIKEIRLRTTKITALKGHDIIVPNDKITSGIIENFNRLPRRRVSLNFLLTSALSVKKTRLIAGQIYQILLENTSFLEKIDIKAVVFDEITSQGLRFKIIYYFRGSNYMEHLQYKEKINLIILEILEKNHAPLVQISDFSASSSE